MKVVSDTQTREGLSAALSGAGMGKDSGSASSTTTAGISGIAGHLDTPLG